MKNLLLWALFVVTWHTIKKYQDAEYATVSRTNHAEFFDSKQKAEARKKELKSDPKNIDVKLYPVGQEIK